MAATQDPGVLEKFEKWFRPQKITYLSWEMMDNANF
jgi:hypothetical protein